MDESLAEVKAPLAEVKAPLAEVNELLAEVNEPLAEVNEPLAERSRSPFAVPRTSTPAPFGTAQPTQGRQLFHPMNLCPCR